MSDDERYQIIGRVVIGHEEAKKRLAALEGKAKDIGEFVHTVSEHADGQR